MNFKILGSYILLLSMLASGCQSLAHRPSHVPATGNSERNNAPTYNIETLRSEIKQTLPKGEPENKRLQARIHKQQQWKEATDYIEILIGSRDSTLTLTEAQNALNLYAASPYRSDSKIFTRLRTSANSNLRQLAWLYAAKNPSTETADGIRGEIVRILGWRDAMRAVTPGFAEAVRVNRVTEAYSLLRQALIKTGDVAHVQAMIELAPERASDDLLTYLGSVSSADIRAGSARSIKRDTNVAILKHFRVIPPSSYHPNFDTLFVFAVSKNSTFAFHARQALERYLPQESQHLALLLAKQPKDLQAEFTKPTEPGKASRMANLIRDWKAFNSEPEARAPTNK